MDSIVETKINIFLKNILSYWSFCENRSNLMWTFNTKVQNEPVNKNIITENMAQSKHIWTYNMKNFFASII